MVKIAMLEELAENTVITISLSNHYHGAKCWQGKTLVKWLYPCIWKGKLANLVFL